ncbi:SKP1-like protein 21 [Medicago truncatula]|uniref:SKP1-like protein 21 n=1 Tax=Medicago truncatula TaxID=3880 RepID=UPI00196715BE|nr:SKP1-like protein 21 [Medicago truncatula]
MLETEMMNSYVWLQTCDGSIQQVDQEIAMISPFILQEILQKGTGSCKSSPICLPQQVSPSLLSSILDYCQFHHIQGHSNKERKLYDAKFVRIDPDILFALAFAAKSLQLKPLNDLTCHALARLIEGKSPKEIRDMFIWPHDLTEEEILESIINKTCDCKIRHLNRLNINRRKERERVLENVRVKQEEVVVEDERSIEELLSFINGSNDGETKGNKTSKNKKKNRKKKKDQQKNSSMKEEEEEEEDHVVEFDDKIDQALTAKIDKTQ